MCGRFTLFSDDTELVALFDIDVLEGEHPPSYNQAPSQRIRVVVQRHERVLDLATWGLVPTWAKEGFRPLINARSETLTEKPSFRTAAQYHRCLVPTNGYYEWNDGQPYFVALPGAGVIAMAGIYETGKDTGTSAVVTRAAPATLAAIHPRCPLFVPQVFWSDWLSPEITAVEDVAELIGKLSVPDLEARPVSRTVGNVGVDDPEEIFAGEDATLF